MTAVPHEAIERGSFGPRSVLWSQGKGGHFAGFHGNDPCRPTFALNRRSVPGDLNLFAASHSIEELGQMRLRLVCTDGFDEVPPWVDWSNSARLSSSCFRDRW